MGVDALVKLNQAYKEIGIELSLACCKSNIKINLVQIIIILVIKQT